MFYVLYLTLFGLALSFPQVITNPSQYFVHPNSRDSAISSRIIGGEEATPHEFPYQVGLYCNTSSGTSFCGGSLVSANYVITAAHCVEEAMTVDVILGAHQITETEDTQLQLTSDEFIIHEAWNKALLINDIAFIKLPQPVEENDYIKIVKIASGDESYAGDKGTITGWGRLANNQDGVTPILRYLIGEILSNDDCKAIDPYGTVIQDTHMCLSGVINDINVGTCNGDSGGPLTVDGTQVGLVSFGYKDCDAGKPSVFTRLTEFGDWIRANSDVDV